jgi:hypothetical protein
MPRTPLMGTYGTAGDGYVTRCLAGLNGVQGAQLLAGGVGGSAPDGAPFGMPDPAAGPLPGGSR